MPKVEFKVTFGAVMAVRVESRMLPDELTVAAVPALMPPAPIVTV